METGSHNHYLAAVIGAGPAGIYAAKQLANQGVYVVLINRDIKPGGLAEYGIYHSKHKMKEGLRNQFRRILETPEIEYFGNLVVGQEGDLSLKELQALGFQAVLVTVGAQGTKWLGLPGEDLVGVYHAKDIVYHYNQLPPFSQMEFAIGKKVAIIGVGNVMLDIARWLIRDVKVDQVTAVARRGPAEVKFTKKEMESVARNLDLKALDEEIERVAPRMGDVGQDPAASKEFILSALEKAKDPVSESRFIFDFLASPSRMIGNERGEVIGLEVEDTALEPKNGDTKAKRLGTKRVLEVDTVIFCIGDRVDEDFGLPVRWNEFVKNPAPSFPVQENSYEAYDPEREKPVEGVFVAGWSREASNGLVGVARKDGESGAQAVLQYLDTQTPADDFLQRLNNFRAHVAKLDKKVVSKAEWQRLEAHEQIEAEKRGLEAFKYASNNEMLAAIEKAAPQPAD
ncbi:MAG: FAD-dependent oxidoreductase [Chloroflexota bacterium]|nr:MAG: FAD-dependent oxidoreductase [Chloroflexota bacterium]